MDGILELLSDPAEDVLLRRNFLADRKYHHDGARHHQQADLSGPSGRLVIDDVRYDAALRSGADGARRSGGIPRQDNTYT